MKEVKATYAGKMRVCRIIWQFEPDGISTVSEPEQGAPPTNWSSFDEVQHRWQILPELTLLGFVLAALPASIRKPCGSGSATQSTNTASDITPTFLKAVVFPLGI